MRIKTKYQTNQQPAKGDLFSKNTSVKDYYPGSTTLKKGRHTIRFEYTGQNDNSKGNYLGFDSFRLRERWLKKRASLK